MRKSRRRLASVRGGLIPDRAAGSLGGMVSCRDSPFSGLIAVAEPFRQAVEMARRAAACEAGVLLTGETGTGKGLLARAIHDASPRRSAPFVPVDCAALPSGLLSSELFGHRRGSFSGADRDRVGRLEAAGGGTLFLDGIDDLDLDAQALLLRAIETREVMPVGETRARRVDFRVVASASDRLRRSVAGGRFRADLFYRVNVVEIPLAPLRERSEDIPHLAAAFLKECARRFAKPLSGFSSGALRVLLDHDWPGNVRELGAHIEAAAAAARGERIEESDLPVRLRAPSSPAMPLSPGTAPEAAAGESSSDLTPARTFASRVEQFQRALVVEALGRKGWSYCDAARELGLERHQLKYLCAKLGIRRTTAEL